MTPFVSEDIRELDGALCYRLARPDADSRIGPDLWHPTGITEWQTGDAQEAVKVCRQCPVRFECLRQAVRNNEQHGIWGGYDFGIPDQKRRARKLAGEDAA